jgi:hypothetical protein
MRSWGIARVKIFVLRFSDCHSLKKATKRSAGAVWLQILYYRRCTTFFASDSFPSKIQINI